MLFRRGQAEPTVDATESEPVDDGPGRAAPKGRPTPSRKEAEAARKARAKPPTDRRSGARGDRAQARADRLRTREALATGDQRYLPARDKGPIRAFVRDYVDSRRTVGEYMLPALLLFVPLTLAMSSISNPSLRATVVLMTYAYMLLIVVGTSLLAVRAKREAAKRFPDDELRGAGLYAAMRSLQLRRWRLPKARVKPGDPL